MIDLDAIKARAEAAEPEPWTFHKFNDTYSIEGKDLIVADEVESRSDAAFIAAARTDVPALVAEVERLQAEVEQLNGLVAALHYLDGTLYPEQRR